jgi:hypothetical protein
MNNGDAPFDMGDLSQQIDVACRTQSSIEDTSANRMPSLHQTE